MINKTGIIIAGIFCFCIFISCKKETKCVAGSGGDISIVARLRHHGVLIPNDSLRPDTVWVKFNATTWSNPPSGYNLRFIGEAGEDHVHVTGLTCGDYFFYGAGYDTTIGQKVTGGIQYSADGKTKEIDPFNIPVTE